MRLAARPGIMPGMQKQVTAWGAQLVIVCALLFLPRVSAAQATPARGAPTTTPAAKTPAAKTPAAKTPVAKSAPQAKAGVPSKAATPTKPTPTPPTSVDTIEPIIDPNREASRVMFEGGVKAYKDRRYDEAIELFQRANQIKPSAAFSFNIGIAYQDAGEIPQALRYFRDYLRQDPGAADRAEVSERIRQLEAKLQVTGLQQLTVLTDPTGAAILVDGEAVGASPWTGELKPGNHKLAVKLQGYRIEERSIDLPADRAIDVPITLTYGTEAPKVEAKPAALPKLHLPPVAWYRDVRPVTWGVLGVGVAALGVAVMCDLSRGSAQAAAHDEPRNDVRAELLDTVETRRTWADAFLLLGLGMTATSGVLMFADVAEQRHLRRQGEESAWAFGCGSRSCSLRYAGTF